jgi:hypothetical protein
MKKLLILSLTLISSIAMGSELNVPNQFEDGQVTSAEQMNANFEAIQAAVNDNHARIESMQQPTKAVFQGFSTESMNGGQGLIAMQQACHNFVPGSHICSTSEFAQSSYNEDAIADLTGSAWIIFSVGGGGPGNNIGSARIFEANSMSVTTGLSSCSGWTEDSSGYTGRIVSTNGFMGLADCDTQQKVACCK